GLVRDILTDLLGMPEHQIRVIATDVGGGFGAKASLYPEEIATCVMARRLGRPVKWIGDRREDLLSTTHAWDEIVEAELGVDRAGRQLGIDPTEIRLRNFIRDEDFPYKSPSGIVWDRASFTGSLLKAREALDYKAARDEQMRARTAGRWLGIGVASYVELTGI